MILKNRIKMPLGQQQTTKESQSSFQNHVSTLNCLIHSMFCFYESKQFYYLLHCFCDNKKLITQVRMSSDTKGNVTKVFFVQIRFKGIKDIQLVP